MNLEGFKHGDDIIVTLSSVMGSMPVQGKLIRGPYKGRGEAWFIHHNNSTFIGDRCHSVRTSDPLSTDYRFGWVLYSGACYVVGSLRSKGIDVKHKIKKFSMT